MYDVTRRGFLAAAAAGAFQFSGLSTAAKESSRPNILFIFSDDHAQQAISAYGSTINKTPNIDRLAADGAIFLRNTCGNSICAPSRATVLTGKHSHANGQRTNADTFDGTQTTFPQVLQRAGYATALIGKWHLRSDPTGFDHWEILPGQGNYYNPDFIDKNGKHRVDGYVTDIISDRAIAWLDEHRPFNQPFLMMCQHKAPHRTWAPSPNHLDLYRDVTIPEPPTLFDDYTGRTPLLAQNEATIAHHMMYDYDLKLPGLNEPDALGRNFPNDETARMTSEQLALWKAAYGPENEAFSKNRPQGKDLVRWKYQRYIKDYLRCIASVDDNVGRILEYLDLHGLAQNTIVVYASDQGFYLGEHGLYDKRWMYRESLAMPFMMRWPAIIKPGTRIDRLTQNIDFAPTFLDAAGQTPSADMQGRSLMPLCRGESPADWRDAIYYHYYETGEHHVPRHEGICTERYKLIHYYDTDQWELFDLQEDPQEMRSIVNDSESAPLVAELKTKLATLKTQYGVPESDCIPPQKAHN